MSSPAKITDTQRASGRIFPPMHLRALRQAPGGSSRQNHLRASEMAHHASRKVYSLHAPEVECIGKGKAHRGYEFGVKVSPPCSIVSKGGQLPPANR